MYSRRRFLSVAAAASLANVARLPRLRAAQYDLLIKGGRVIDPSRKIDARSDIAISRGKIAAVRPDIPTSAAAATLDATGKLVVPGLVDIHTHAVREKDDAALCLADGVTSLVDAGSRGSDRIDEAVEIAKTSPSRMRLLINISRTGNDQQNGELLDLAKVDLEATRKAIERHRDYVVGIKVRLSNFIAGRNDLPALKLAQSIAGPLGVPIMIHMGQSETPLQDLLAVLKRGDIVTHIYSPPPHGIFDNAGRLLPAVLDARKRGIWFDVGNGLNKHITWDIAERATTAGLWPDTISTDWVPMGRADQIFDLGTVLSKFLLLGMPLERVIACATANAVRAMPAFEGLGTLAPGAAADVAVMELKRGAFEFVDNDRANRTGSMKLVTVRVLKDGKAVL
ncbi:MAG TPA: amidohydrolase/deacetylase family metallohydrolase [Vicinamibacterales bacterium]|nr:amidohydrolase/deacetylase family metallohydrolase [Vicinamibacterales bacterium]